MESTLEFFSYEKNSRLDNFMRQISHFHTLNLTLFIINSNLSFWILKVPIFIHFFPFMSPSFFVFKALFDEKVLFILIKILPFFKYYKSDFTHLLLRILLYEIFFFCHKIKHESKKLFFGSESLDKVIWIKLSRCLFNFFLNNFLAAFRNC